MDVSKAYRSGLPHASARSRVVFNGGRHPRPAGTGETPVLHFRCNPSCKFFHLDDKPKLDQTLANLNGFSLRKGMYE